MAALTKMERLQNKLKVASLKKQKAIEEEKLILSEIEQEEMKLIEQKQKEAGLSNSDLVQLLEERIQSKKRED